MTAFDRVKDFIAQKYLGFKPSIDIKLDTRLSEDLDLEGDDAIDFFEKFEDEFKIDLSNLNLDVYFHGEGFNPLTFVVELLKSNKKKSITVKDLVRAFEIGKWIDP